MKLALLVPGSLDTISGGYSYDGRLVDGLRALGHKAGFAIMAGRYPLPDDAALNAADSTLEALAPDIVPVIDGLCLPSFAPVVDALARRGAVALVHHPTALETGFSETDRERLRAVERDLFGRVARIVATSPLTARRLVEDFGADPGRVGVVEPGTDPAPRATGSGGPGAVLLSVGALVPRKGHDVLLRALAGLADLDWRLVIAGPEGRDPVHARGLRALAEELGIAQRVEFAGAVDAGTLEALFAGADVFALASHWEGYGMAVAEALARGLPVAVTAGGALAELAPADASVVSPPGDHVSLGKGLRRMIFDTDLRRRMAEAAWRAGQRLPRWEDRAEAFVAEIGKRHA